jgi:hypothetical protein
MVTLKSGNAAVFEDANKLFAKNMRTRFLNTRAKSHYYFEGYRKNSRILSSHAARVLEPSSLLK